MIIKFIKTFARDEDGATAIEYGLFAALIAAGIVTVVGLLGDELVATFEVIKTAVTIPE
ncbi:hypothetical protein DSM110093_03812 (plasmid) [Sulfitobacter sp. DSM 110093]|uniref:Flp family type IVb pilin n=1 Tax=Sulfitobacter sp. DSM 110093 TaxID=2883127 RepID=UPI001FADC5D8|nr:Flp family type IVb pilin [Sulfitobacter sp. DSM 110093]UOA33716.1 hypothetical protein DSM110093_03551 [Sulfitobacter sp. DSM 110093]UOA33977.1 hypothetical protein DSM110093_03812 [Sulfitobacter sp. DSM 110093]